MHTLLISLFCLISALDLTIADIGYTQSASVKGQLLCAGVPAAEVKVKLEDYDYGPDPDDLMDSGYTDGEGRFALAGDTSEIATIDPRILIFHDCNDKTGLAENPCQRRWTIIVPDKYVTKGKTSNKTFDLGSVELEVQIDGETRDCVH